jgi:D-3-phosphoglycerate dehydrogenase
MKSSMVDPVVEPLILDLLEWLARGDRSYEDVMSAWRTSCPRLPVWEDANDRGLVMTAEADGRTFVKVTAAGFALIEHHHRFALISGR